MDDAAISIWVRDPIIKLARSIFFQQNVESSLLNLTIELGDVEIRLT